MVTGGNQGLGRAFVFALAAAGARVAFSGRREDANRLVAAEAARTGYELVPITADVTDDAQVDTMVAQAEDAFDGRIDVLVNNAGRCHHAPSSELTDDQWAGVFDLNVRAVWKTSTIVADVMRAHGSGSIVNVGSISGLIVNRPQFQAGYNASKAAVHHLTRSLAVEWASFGIRVNAIAPGYVQADGVPADRPELRRHWRPEFRQHWVDDAPQRRFALPEEIAPSAVFLASDAASFITGTVLVADGGYTAA
nr:SDR family oxidoreductase [Allobranchiibius huperziae]